MAKRVTFIFVTIILFITISASIIIIHLFLDIVPLCTPPKDAYEIYRNTKKNQTLYHAPLVEYYIHGRGNGHYARSVAIIERLKDAGIDVRMFIGGGKNGNFQFIQESPHFELQSTKHQRRGKVTTLVVPSLIPGLSCLHSFSVLIDRLLVDCSQSKYTHQYPLLVLSDGDFPGMFRAKLGSIPSVGIAHGQIFAIGKMPKYIENSDISTKGAWEKERFLNKRASFFSNWQIGTNFVNLLTERQSAVIAKSPMRPEIEQMENERRIRSDYVNTYGYNFKGNCQSNKKTNNRTGSLLIKGTKGFWSLEQETLLRDLLLGREMSNAIDLLRLILHENKISNLTQKNMTTYHLKEQLSQWYQDHNFVMPFRRKLVICYFRDKNGGLLLNALLRSGFDVLLFEKGYHKGLSDMDDGKIKFGQQYILKGKDSDLSSFSSSSSNNTINMSYRRDFVTRTEHVSINNQSSISFSDKQLLAPKPSPSSNLTNYNLFYSNGIIHPPSTLLQKNILQHEDLILQDNILNDDSVLVLHSKITQSRKKQIDIESKGTYKDLERLMNIYKTHEVLPKQYMSNSLLKSNLSMYNYYDINNFTSFNPEKSIDQLNWIVSQISKLFESNHHSNPPRILRVTDMSLFVPLLSIADGVASSAGSQLISECIYANMPLLALYRENDGEQMLNVEMSRHRLDNEADLKNRQKNPGEILPPRNLVYGMSLENFEEVFSFLLNKGQTEESSEDYDSRNFYKMDPKSDLLKCDKMSLNDTLKNKCLRIFGNLESKYPMPSPWNHRTYRIASEAEESSFLNNSRTRNIYTTFTDYVESINLSPVSWTYYHDIFSEFVDYSEERIRNSPLKTGFITNCSKSLMHRYENVDPFYGMEDASSVILNIIKQVLNDHA